MTADRLLAPLLASLVTRWRLSADPGLDDLRFPSSRRQRTLRWLKSRLLGLANRAGFVYAPGWEGYALEQAAVVDRVFPELSRLYAGLGDDYSRDLLITLLTYRLLGPRHARLPRQSPEHWAAHHSVDRRHLRHRNVQQTAAGWWLNEYEAPGVNGPVRLRCHALNVRDTFVFEQYAYRQRDRQIAVQPGDVVVDGGSCWGDSALYFADRTGPAGRVLGFEFNPDNLTVLRQNIALQPELGQRITVVPQALWDRSDVTLSFADSGPATTLSQAAADDQRSDASAQGQATTAAIDDVVDRLALPTVDFIKLDVEGAELPALRGAARTIRSHRPTLAVAVYHRPEDLATIPAHIAGLDLGYEFYLDHFTTHNEETVLFAVARRG